MSQSPESAANQSEGTATEPSKNSDRLHLALIVLATFLSFGVVMGGYFIADDTWQLQFAYRVFNGEWRLVTDNFTHSYLGLPSMDFYRPLLGLTYLADYAIYHTAAWGYYLTNILLAAAAGIILYFFLRYLALFSFESEERAEKFAFVSALLFAVSPLHAEDICWISGRADLLAAPFYLFSLLAAARGRDWWSGKINWQFYIASLVAFALSLLSKESAVTVPLVVAAMFFFFRKKESPEINHGKESHGKVSTEPSAVVPQKLSTLVRVRQFCLYLSPYAILTVAYLFIRKEALGSFIGGYTGDMGEALGKWLWFRWLDPLNLFRMAFPVAKHSFHSFNLTVDQTPSIVILGTIYAVIFSLLLIRFMTQKTGGRLVVFLCLWLAASIVPLAKLWGLDASLHNQRVLYLFTAPMVALLPALFYAPKVADRPTMQKQFMVLTAPIEEFILTCGGWAFYALSACLVIFSALASYNWLLAGKQVEAIQNKTMAEIQNKLQSKDQVDKKMIVVSVPKDYLGAHVLMGGVNMLELLEQPFLKEHLSQYMIGFQRALVGPGEPINCTRFKLELSALKNRRAYFWDVDKKDYKVVDYEDPPPDTPEKLDLPLASSAPVDKAAAPRALWYPVPADKATYKTIVSKGEAGKKMPAIALDNLAQQGGDGLVITGLDINPLAYDYLNMTISLPHAQQATGVYVAFDDQVDANAPFKEEAQVSKLLEVTRVPVGAPLDQSVLNIKLSHFGQWYAYKKIRRLQLTFSNIKAVEISDLSLSDDRRLLPLLFVMEAQPQASGEYFCRKNEPVKFVVDAGMVPGAKGAVVEISKVNQSWDTFLTEKVHGQDSVVNYSYSLPLKDRRAYFKLDPRTYAGNGFYDVRAALVDDKNKIISDWSDLITLYQPDPDGKPATFCADY